MLDELRADDVNQITDPRHVKQTHRSKRLWNEYGDELVDVVRSVMMKGMVGGKAAGSIQTWDYFGQALEDGPVPVAQTAADEGPGPPPHTTPGAADESRRLIAEEPRETPAGVADRFLLNAMYPSPGGSVAVDDLRDVYLDWCASRHREPLPDEEIAAAINDIFRRVSLPVIDVDGTRMVIGVGLKEQEAAS